MQREKTGLRHWLAMLFLLPVLPCFLWGPFMHPTINFRALKKARRRADEGDNRVNRELVEACEENLDAFVFGANSADTVSANHVVTGLTIYDYAHNSVPDHAKGVPFFGYALIDQWFRLPKGKQNKHDLALACGWLGHQLADWYPHYACMEKGGVLSQDPTNIADEISTFSGFADAHLILGDNFFPSVLRTNAVVEHALIELFYDIIAVDEDPHELFADPHKCLAMFPGTDDNLLTVTSERFRGRFTRVPPEHIPSLTQHFQQVIFVLRLLIESIRIHKPNLVQDLRTRFWRDEFVEHSVDRVVTDLFCRDLAEIAKLAVPQTDEHPPSSWESYRLINSKMGTTLFDILYSLGKPLKTREPARLWKAVRDPAELLVPRNGPLPIRWVKTGLIRYLVVPQLKRRLRELMDTHIYRSSLMEKNAIVSFLLALLITEESDPIDLAIQSYKRAAQPIVTLDLEPSGVLPSPESVAMLFRNGQIPIRISPAVPPDDPDLGALKALDRSTLIFRIDGYDVTHRPDLFDVAEERWEDGELVLNVGLHGSLEGDQHHIFVDIHDHTGTHSKYLDLEVTLSRSTHVSEAAANRQLVRQAARSS